MCEPTVNSLSHQVPLLMCGNEKNSTVMQHECNTLSEVTLLLPLMSLTLRSETAGKQRRLFKTCFEQSFSGFKKGGLCKEHIGRGRWRYNTARCKMLDRCYFATQALNTTMQFKLHLYSVFALPFRSLGAFFISYLYVFTLFRIIVKSTKLYGITQT